MYGSIATGDRYDEAPDEPDLFDFELERQWTLHDPAPRTLYITAKTKAGMANTFGSRTVELSDQGYILIVDPEDALAPDDFETAHNGF